MASMLVTSSLSILLGREMLSQTISKSSNNILTGVYSILQDEDFAFKKILLEYDLYNKLEVISSYVSEDIKSSSESVKICLKNIGETMIKLEKNIKNIEEKIKEHKNLWFYRFRTPNYINLIKDLEIDIKILSDRFDLLIKIKN